MDRDRIGFSADDAMGTAHTEKLSSTRCSTSKQAKNKSGKLKRPGQDEAVGRDENVHEENTKFSVNLAGTPNALQ